MISVLEYANGCSSGTDVIGETECFLIALKAWHTLKRKCVSGPTNNQLRTHGGELMCSRSEGTIIIC